MLRIRLSRVGAKNNPSYRIVVIEKTKKRDGGTTDILGYWYPKKDNLKIDKTKLEAWISKGAQVSESVNKLLKAKK